MLNNPGFARFTLRRMTSNRMKADRERDLSLVIKVNQWFQTHAQGTTTGPPKTKLRVENRFFFKILEFYPPASKASRDVAILTERKNSHPSVCYQIRPQLSQDWQSRPNQPNLT